MAKYIHFTEEEKEQANQVDLEHFLLQQGEKLIPSGNGSPPTTASLSEETSGTITQLRKVAMPLTLSKTFMVCHSPMQ